MRYQPGEEQLGPARGGGAVEEGRGRDVEQGEDQEGGRDQGTVGRDHSDAGHNFPGRLQITINIEIIKPENSSYFQTVNGNHKKAAVTVFQVSTNCYLY